MFGDSVYKFNVTYQKRNFVGQKTGNVVSEGVINANTLDEILEQIWVNAQQHNLMEVLVFNEKFCGVEKKDLSVKDIDKFIIIQDKVSKKVHVPSKLKPETIKGFGSKCINVLIHIYSINVSSHKTWNIIKEKVEALELKEKSGVETLIKMTDKIKKISKDTAPWNSIKLPKTIPIKNKKGQISENDWDSIRESYETMRSTVVNAFNNFGVTMQAIENKPAKGSKKSRLDEDS